MPYNIENCNVTTYSYLEYSGDVSNIGSSIAMIYGTDVEHFGDIGGPIIIEIEPDNSSANLGDNPGFEYVVSAENFSIAGFQPTEWIVDGVVDSWNITLPPNYLDGVDQEEVFGGLPEVSQVNAGGHHEEEVFGGLPIQPGNPNIV